MATEGDAGPWVVRELAQRAWTHAGATLVLLVTEEDPPGSGLYAIAEARTTPGRGVVTPAQSIATKRMGGLGSLQLARDIADAMGEAFARGGDVGPIGPLKGELGPLELRCQEHGAGPWLHTVVCLDCQRGWRLSDDATSEQPDPKHGRACVCGADLTERGRAICERCYLDLRAGFTRRDLGGEA